MRTRDESGDVVWPGRLLEMLEFRFGAFEVIARTACELADRDPELRPPMDRTTAWAILEFGQDLRQACEAAVEWAERERSGCRAGEPDDTPKPA